MTTHDGAIRQVVSQQLSLSSSPPRSTSVRPSAQHLLCFPFPPFLCLLSVDRADRVTAQGGTQGAPDIP